jgi:DNA topoisomerase-1
MHLVIVESPAKSKTINKYLGSDYKVLASFGHVRDLPAKDGSVRPDEDFDMTYEVSDDKQKQINEITRAAKEADSILLATDPDREGEAISWHVLEVLKQKKALKAGTKIHRVVFNEITPRAVKEGIANPRELDMNLINAQQARRALDYLVGFNLSPVLWRKLPGSRSAGRVQSVALRLICEREGEIEQFQKEEYWDIGAQFTTPKGDSMTARLVHYAGDKCEKFTFTHEAGAKAAVAELEKARYSVSAITPKQVKRQPYAPFTTSTLQQEASRKLGFGAKRTMQLAQKLYEGVPINGETVGLITYMRTDGVYVANEAIQQARQLIAKEHGDEYLPSSPRMYQSKAKNAQEAHEAIRPTDMFKTPKAIGSQLDDDMRKLYNLIWTRMIASQMAAAVLDQLSVEMASEDKRHVFRASGSRVAFPGFYAIYREGRDDGVDEDGEQILPPVNVNDPMKAEEITTVQHFTEPPPRYSEASLVKRMEELGIGRPSTYASIISVLQDREYVRLDKKRFIPEARGRIVTSFLESFFQRYVEYDFTAKLETALDDVSAGERNWKQLLREFWNDFSVNTEQAKALPGPEIIQQIENLLSSYLFAGKEGQANPRLCPACQKGSLGLKTGKFGAFLGCSNYPECRYTSQLDGQASKGEDGESGGTEAFPKILGKHPESGHPVSLRKGPYGVYVQIDDGSEKPKRQGLNKGQKAETVTLEDALALLALPRTVGNHPESGKPIRAGIGRFGPYVESGGVFASLPAGVSPLDIGMNHAVSLLEEKANKAKATAGTSLGQHPGTKKDIVLVQGRYGPYLRHGTSNVAIPKAQQKDDITLEVAIGFVDASGDSGNGKKGAKGKKAPAKAPAKKAKPEKPATAKAAVKKAATKTTTKKAPAKKAPTRKAS